jgi:hypothetical protein
MSLGGMFVATLFTPWGLVVGGAVATIPVIIWFWPKRSDKAGPAYRHGVRRQEHAA